MDSSTELLRKFQCSIEDDPNWKELQENYCSAFNVFDVLGITRTEIRHSRVLAWLMDPKENHELGDLVLKRILMYACDDEEVLSKISFSDFSIFRECCNIDILAVNDSSKYTLCIENKLDSNEHYAAKTGKYQTDAYIDYVDELYPEYPQENKKYIYLSLDGADSHNERWVSMSYENVYNILQSIWEEKQSSVHNRDVAVFINHYLDALRRKVMVDPELTKLCDNLYNKYQKEIDLILERKTDRFSLIDKYVKQWVQEKADKKELEYKPDIFNSKGSGRTTRFITSELRQLFPERGKGNSSNEDCWNESPCLYEFICNPKLQCIECVDDKYFILSLKYTICNEAVKDESKDKIERIKVKAGITKSKRYPYKLFKSSRTIDMDNITYDDVCESLDECFKKASNFNAELAKMFLLDISQP